MGSLGVSISHTGVTDALGQVTTTVWDARNRRSSTTDRVGAATTFIYDIVGNLLSITDAEGGVTRYGYDARNLLVSEEYPPGLATPKRSTDVGAILPSPGSAGNVDLRSYTYDAGRRLSSRLDQAGVVTTYTYDNANRLTTRAYGDAGGNDSFAYDHASRLTNADSGRYGTAVVRTYDSAGRLTAETQNVAGRSGTVHLAYDDANRKIGLTAPNSHITSYAYTDRNEWLTAHFDGAIVASRVYDPGMRLTTTTYGNGVIEQRTYVPGDRLVATINATGPAGPVTGFSYRYDANKRKTLEQDTVLPTWSQGFGYDAQDRLIDWKQGPPNGLGGIATPDRTQDWLLTAVGDWQQTTRGGSSPDGAPLETRAHTKVHEIATIDRGAGIIPLAYDHKGNLTQDDRGLAFYWDPENRLARALIPQQAATTTEAANPGGWAQYTYDALGRRLAKTWQGVTTIFWHEGAQIIQESDVRPGVSTAEAASDGSLANGSLSPGHSGGILSGAVLHRINFQPAASPIPEGYLADKGRGYSLDRKSVV